MKRKYLAFFLAVMTTVSQISGATSFALAADLIVEPEAVETTVETTAGNLTTPLDGEVDAAAEEEYAVTMQSAENQAESQDEILGEEEFGEIEDTALDADWDDDTDDLQDLDADEGEQEPVEEGTTGENTVSADATEEEGVADSYNVTALNLGTELTVTSITAASDPGLTTYSEDNDNEDEEDSKIGPQITWEWENGTNWMRPGESQEITVEAWFEQQDDEGDYYRDKSNRILLTWNYENDYINVEESKDSEWRDNNTIIKTFKVTVKDKAADAINALWDSDGNPTTDEDGNEITWLEVGIKFAICPVEEDWETVVSDEDNNPIWQTERTADLYLSNRYTNLLPVSIDQMAVGEVQEITAALTDYYMDDNGKLQSGIRADVRYSWDWDPDQMKIWYEDDEDNNNKIVLNTEDGSNSVVSDNSSGVTFYLQKLTNEETTITLYTQVKDEDDQWQDDANRSYWFGSTDYIYGIEEEIENDPIPLKIFPSDEQTLTAAITDEVAEMNNWKIEWEVGFWNEASGTVDALDNKQWKAYSVLEDNCSIKLNGKKIQEALKLQDDTWFGVWAYVMVTLDEEVFEVDRYDCGIQYLEECYELQDLRWEYDEVLPGWEDSFRKETTVWVRNAQYPDGSKLPAMITDVSTKRSEEDQDSTKLPISCEAGKWDDDTACYYLKAENHGCAEVTVQYQIGTYDETGAANYDDNSEIYDYTYEVYVGIDRYDIRLTSDRDINGFTDLQPGDFVTLYAEVNPAYENDEEPQNPPTITVGWKIEDEENNKQYITLTPNEDGTECRVEVKDDIENIEDREIKVIATVMVQWDGDKGQSERASAEWWVNVRNAYFQITLDKSGNHYDYSLENGDQITVVPTLEAIGEELAVPNDIVWCWEEWDPERLAIRDSSEDDESEENDGEENVDVNSDEGSDDEATGKELSPEDNTGKPPFTLTKLGNEQTDICLRAYSGEDQLAQLWLNFSDQNYGIWYENLKERDRTWLYTDEDPVIKLNTDNLQDKKKYQIEWYLGTFNEDGEPTEDQMIAATDEETAGGYTVSEDSASIRLNLEYLKDWMSDQERDSITVQARVLTQTTSAEETPEILAQTDHIEVEVRDTVYDYNFGLDVDDDGISRPATDEGRCIYKEIDVYVENAANPDGTTWRTQVENVSLSIDDAWPQKAIILDEGEDEEGNPRWELQFLNQCTGTITITYVDVLTKESTTIEIPVEVQNEGYYFEFDRVDDRYLYPGETMQIQARVAHWQQNAERISDDKEISVDWEITEQRDAYGNEVDEENPVVSLAPTDSNKSSDDTEPLTSGEEATISDRNYTVTAVQPGEANIRLTAWATDGEETWPVAEENIWVCVNDLKIVDENDTAMEQYADYGQPVALSLKLKQSGEDEPSDYTGEVRYIWEFDQQNIEVSPADNAAIEISEEDGRIVMTVKTEEDDSTQGDNSTEEAQEAAGAESDGEKDTAKSLGVVLLRCADDWGCVRVIAQIKNENTDEWHDAASREWHFNEYDKNIWPKDARGDYYTWIYSDEKDYELTMDVNAGMLKNDRWMEYTIGIAEGVDENRIVIATYPKTENVTGGATALDGDNTESTNGERVNWTAEGTTLTIKDGKALGEWIQKQRKKWSDEHDGADSNEALELFIEATVKMDVLDDEENSEEEDSGNTDTDATTQTACYSESEPAEGYKRVEVNSCRIGFGMRTSYEYWEDSDAEELLLGQTGLYYDYNEKYGCITISQDVYDAAHPWGDTKYYKLVSVESSNENVLEIVTDCDESDKAVRYNIEPVGAGEAQITYTIQAIGEENAESFTKVYTKYVIGSTYVGSITLSGDNEYLKKGESRRLRLVVKQRQSVQDSDGNWSVKMTALPENQYTVHYVDQTDGKLKIDGDMVTVLDASEGWGGVEAIVTIPQGEGKEDYELNVTAEFALTEDWYAFDLQEEYSDKPGETITITPQLYHYYESGTQKESWTKKIEEWSIEENWTTGGVDLKEEDGSFIITSANEETEGASVFYLRATIINEYGYREEVESWFWVGFCDHKASDEWQVSYWSTCSEEGEQELWCSKCGYIMESKPIEKLEHTWDDGTVTKAATCKEEGVKTYTCTVCDETKTEPIAKLTAHSWNDGEVTKAATCKEEGVKTYTCKVCGETKTEPIVKLTTHSWDGGKVTKAATCKEAGEKTYTCKVCGTTKTELIAKLTTHTWDNGTVTKAATCKEAGVKTYTCKVCGETKTESIAKLTTHTWDNGTVTKAATCKETGVKTYTCKVCGKTKTETIAKLTTHTWGSYTVTKQATAVAAGTEIHSCKICGASESRTIAKLTPTIKLTETKLKLQLKKSASLKSLVTNLASGDAIASWKSSNSKIVTVDKKGKITGKKLGKANITVTLKSKLSAKITVTVQKKAIATTKLEVTSKTITLMKGKKTTLNPIVTPVTATDKVTYKTSDEKVATVNAKGQVDAKASGTATITIKSGKQSVKVKVIVKAIQPTKITGVPTSKTLKKGDSLTLKPKLSPAGSEATIKYSTSDKSVATVSAKGKIKAKKKGTAVITVKAGNVTTRCTIKVK